MQNHIGHRVVGAVYNPLYRNAGILPVNLLTPRVLLVFNIQQNVTSTE